MLSRSLLCNIGGGRFSQWEIFPSHGASGGILIGWDDKTVSLLASHVGSFSLSIKLKNTLNNFEWWLTGVYGPCTSNLKSAFIDELRQLINLMGSNWVATE